MARTGALTPPTEASLHEAALAHLARYATTQLGLVRVLDRRIERWARVAEADTEAIQAAKRISVGVVARLVAAGLVDDAAFAAARASRLVRSGHSQRAVAAHLAARGVAVRQAMSGDEELGAALVLAHRRRIGPFRRNAVEPNTARRELGMLARAGFPREVAMRALAMDAGDAEELVKKLRQS